MQNTNTVIAASFLCVALCWSPAAAATITAATCNRADVGDAVASAASGDVVTVPAGTCTWTTTLTITNKSLTLMGAGIGRTVIIDRAPGGWPSAMSAIQWTLEDTGLSRISGFTFRDDTGTNDGNSAGVIRISGASSQFRFDHNRLENVYMHGLRVVDYVRGVIDNNEFVITSGRIAIKVEHGKWGGVGDYGDNSWAVAAPLGTANALFIEHNTASITGGSAMTSFIDGDVGERRVVRYNTLTDVAIFAHGTATSGRLRGGRSFEIYENDIYYTQVLGTVIAFGSGTGVVYNNRLHTSGGGVIEYGIGLSYWRFTDRGRPYPSWGWCGQTVINSLTHSGTTATATVNAGHGMTSDFWYPQVRVTGAVQAVYNGIFTATNYSDGIHFSYTMTGTPASDATGPLKLTSAWDGNTDASGYPCLDQPGRGSGNLISSDYPMPGFWPNQALEPVYVWGNTKNGASLGVNSEAAVIVLNRDYYESEKPGYMPYRYPHPLIGPAAPANVKIR